ncbi:MAG: hypothetical protein RLY93_16265 [Sumerlaeia bacterium]
MTSKSIQDLTERGVLSTLWEETCAALEGLFPMRETPIPREFALRLPLNPKSDSVLTFNDRAVEGVGDLRATLIAGSRAEIVNVMLFPADVQRHPVFASEIVVFAKALRVGVIDLQPLVRTQEQEGLIEGDLAALRSRFGDLSDGGELPDWAREHFTPACVHVREPGLESLPRLREAYLAYLRLFIQYVRNNPGTPAATEDPALRHYKDHHIANTPGWPFLSRLYGEDWTRRFLREGMYA